MPPWALPLYFLSSFFFSHRDSLSFFPEQWLMQPEGGHLHLVEFFISKGASDWNRAMVFAAKGGQFHLVEFLKEGLVETENAGE